MKANEKIKHCVLSIHAFGVVLFKVKQNISLAVCHFFSINTLYDWLILQTVSMEITCLNCFFFQRTDDNYNYYLWAKRGMSWQQKKMLRQMVHCMKIYSRFKWTGHEEANTNKCTREKKPQNKLSTFSLKINSI